MHKAGLVGIILLIAGFMVSSVGSSSVAKCNSAYFFPICETGPYGYTVGIAGGCYSRGWSLLSNIHLSEINK